MHERNNYGFNDTRGNHWLGNEQLHQLTKDGRYKLRFDLQARANLTWYYAEYSFFAVSSEASNYTLQASGYSGNAGDALKPHSGMMFTTYDRDNDLHLLTSGYDHFIYNCAVLNGGGFWYYACGRCSVNGIRGRGDNFRWSSETENRLLQSSRMWLTCYT